MNYLILKTIIDSTLVNFRCKDCNSWISEGNISILGLAWNTINLEVTCPNCRVQWVVKAEIWFLNQNWPDILNNLKWSLNQLQANQISWPIETIKDSDILSIRENLKNCNSIEDLFN